MQGQGSWEGVGARRVLLHKGTEFLLLAIVAKDEYRCTGVQRILSDMSGHRGRCRGGPGGLHPENQLTGAETACTVAWAHMGGDQEGPCGLISAVVHIEKGWSYLLRNTPIPEVRASRVQYLFSGATGRTHNRQ